MKEELLALGLPVLGLAMWIDQSNGHGPVAVYGFVLGALVCLPARITPAGAQGRRSPGS
ncbi:hypothetical protein [Streptomyces sp. NPDC048565]|uniref:hypothetical protein n=1 Tax=Streptomyces sp. NPDC048565 TaxID=3155266 RepID=UPI003443E3B0